MLKMAEDYAKKLIVTPFPREIVERYMASTNDQAQASVCGRKPRSGEQIHDPELQKIINLAITNFRRMRADAEARGGACLSAQQTGQFGGRQLNEAIQRYNSAMASGSTGLIAAQKQSLLVVAQNSCNVMLNYYESCNPAAFK
jgi:hypothetical protein